MTAEQEYRSALIRKRIDDMWPRPLNIGYNGDGAILFLLEMLTEAQEGLKLEMEMHREDVAKCQERIEALEREYKCIDEQRAAAAEMALGLQSDLRGIQIANRERESALVALCDALQLMLNEQATDDVLPYESEVRKALEKVRKGLE